MSRGVVLVVIIVLMCYTQDHVVMFSMYARVCGGTATQELHPVHMCVCVVPCLLTAAPVRLFIAVQHGANVRARAWGTFFRHDGPTYYGEFPLSFAVCTGQKEIVAYLIRHGAQVGGGGGLTWLAAGMFVDIGCPCVGHVIWALLVMARSSAEQCVTLIAQYDKFTLCFFWHSLLAVSHQHTSHTHCPFAASHIQ